MALNFYITANFVTILFYFIYVKLQELPMNLIFSSENVLVFDLVKSSPNWFLASLTVGFSSCVSSYFLDAAVVNICWAWIVMVGHIFSLVQAQKVRLQYIVLL